MKYGLSLKSKLILLAMSASLIIGASTGMWKFGIGLFLVSSSIMFHSIYKQQKI